MYALTHCLLYTGNQELRHHALVIDGDRIVDLVPEAHLGDSIPTLDGQGWVACPG